ncbi:MAG: efflux RND transporter periplasmic adaptor subunit [Myxococcota bacterium]
MNAARLLLSLFLCLVGCGGDLRSPGGGVPHEDDHDDHDAPGEHAAEVAPTPGGELRVSSDLKRDLRVSTAPVRAEAGADRVVLLGEVVVHEDALATVAAPLPARVARVRVATGASVSAGDPLVDLESVEVGRARADLLGARAQSLRATSALERKRGLGDVVSRAELEAAEADAAVASAELRSAEAALSALGVGTALPDPVDGRFTLRAPIGGTVLERSVSVGQVVDAEEVLFRVADLTRLQVEAHAFERDAVRLQPGGHADVALSALPGSTFASSVSRVGGEVDVTSRTVAVRLDLAPDPNLRPGMAATATVDAAASGDPVVTVPAAALQRFGGGWVVFVPKDEDTYEIRPVGRGRDLGSAVEVLSGLSAGETVVLDGAFLLKAEAEKRQGGGEAHHDH